MNRPRLGLSEQCRFTPNQTVQVLEILQHNGGQKPQQAAP